MMTPKRWARIAGKTARILRTAPNRFVSKVDRRSSSGSSSTEARVRTPGVVYQHVDPPFSVTHRADRLCGGVVGHVEFGDCHVQSLVLHGSRRLDVGLWSKYSARHPVPSLLEEVRHMSEEARQMTTGVKGLR
jgi:hypothetical protein